MPVIPYVEEPESEELRGLYERLSEGGLGLGVLNVFKIMAHNPRLLRDWLRLATPLLMDGLALSPRLREIAILRVAQNARSEYEFGHHVRIAREVGFTDEEIAALRDYRQDKRFSEVERAVAAYADAASLLTADAPERARDLRRWLSDRELLELTFCIGHWNMIARVLEPLGVEVDDALAAGLPEGWREWM